jgi:hypothetical protein
MPHRSILNLACWYPGLDFRAGTPAISCSVGVSVVLLSVMIGLAKHCVAAMLALDHSGKKVTVFDMAMRVGPICFGLCTNGLNGFGR